MDGVGQMRALVRAGLGNGRRCCWSPAEPVSSGRTSLRASMRRAAPTSRSTTFSAAMVNGAISRNRQVADFVPPADLLRWLDGRKLDAVIHIGAISETTATDGDLVIETNFRLSLRLLDWCTATRTPFIYASSAATYGDGAAGLHRRLVARRAQAPQADESLRLEQASVRSRARRARITHGPNCRRNGPD